MNATIYNTVENTNNVVFFFKEDIGKLTFSKEDVLLNDEEQQNERLQRLIRAMYLGKDKIKVKILFQDTTGEKMVETTIWGISEKHIILKGATTLPIKCAKKIIFY